MEDAVAGKGEETKPCGTHSPAIECAGDLCCGNVAIPDGEMNNYEYVYGKEGAKKILAMETTCEKKHDSPTVKRESRFDKFVNMELPFKCEEKQIGFPCVIVNENDDA